jgi:hypothetical protein
MTILPTPMLYHVLEHGAYEGSPEVIIQARDRVRPVATITFLHTGNTEEDEHERAQAVAVARLFVAAPRLAEVLESLIDLCEEHTFESGSQALDDQLDEARQVLIDALGDNPRDDTPPDNDPVAAEIVTDYLQTKARAA